MRSRTSRHGKHGFLIFRASSEASTPPAASTASSSFLFTQTHKHTSVSVCRPGFCQTRHQQVCRRSTGPSQVRLLPVRWTNTRISTIPVSCRTLVSSHDRQQDFGKLRFLSVCRCVLTCDGQRHGRSVQQDIAGSSFDVDRQPVVLLEPEHQSPLRTEAMTLRKTHV